MSQTLEIDAWSALPPRPSTPQVRGEPPKPTGQVEVVGDPVRVRSSFVNGFQELPVRLQAV